MTPPKHIAILGIGETDFASWLFEAEQFRRFPKILGTDKADYYIDFIGRALGNDDWEAFQHSEAVPGVSVGEAVADFLTKLIGGTETLRWALDEAPRGDADIMLICVLICPAPHANSAAGADESPAYNVRIVGALPTTSTDGGVHFSQFIRNLKYIAPRLREDLETGMFRRGGLIEHLVAQPA